MHMEREKEMLPCEFKGQPGLHREFQASQGYILRHFLNHLKSTGDNHVTQIHSGIEGLVTLHLSVRESILES